MGSWICDGVPKNGQSYPNSEPHPDQPYENFGPNCMICGLPQEAMAVPKKQLPLKQIGIAIGAIAILGAGGFGLWSFLNRESEEPVVGDEPTSSPTSSPTTSPTVSPNPAIPPGGIISQTASNPQLISQGEKILLPATSPERMRQKQLAAEAFDQENWPQAIALYEEAINMDPNDPESKIYWNNARARAGGSSVAIAVVVPITPSPDSASEILRGVAQYQDEYNRNPTVPGQLLEVIIVNEEQTSIAPALAQDLINHAGVLGVLGHGVDQNSQDAVSQYETASLAVVSPINTNLQNNILQTFPLAQQANQLLTDYLANVGRTLVAYAQQTRSPVRSVIIYNSDSPYSQQLRNSVETALGQSGGTLLQDVDISTTPAFNPQTIMTEAQQTGANVAFLLLSKSRVEDVIALARDNVTLPSPLMLMGGDELYNPTLLLEGDDAIAGLTLAVPWVSQPNDPFAAQAAEIWRGRVSWRTTTAYDATSALVVAINQGSDRAGILQQLQQGVTVPNPAGNIALFQEIPLVEAVRGPGGPQGSRYRFDPIASP